MNDSKPLVSVVIPCFNARRWIEATLASVEAQTWRPLEIVVVDDGSTDGSGEWLEAQAASGRLRLLRQSNAGQPAAFNAAINAAQGDYIQFLDADDLLDPTKIGLQIERLIGRPNCIAACEWGRFYGPDPGTARFIEEACWRDLRPDEWFAAAYREGAAMLFPALWLVPRSVVKAAGPWNEALAGRNPDGEYFIRALAQCENVLFAQGARVRYRSGLQGSMSAAPGEHNLARQLESLRLIESHVTPWLSRADVASGLSLAYQRFAQSAYPYSRSLAEQAFVKACALSGKRLRPDGGWRYRLLSALMGWRFARQLQVWSGRP